MKFSLKSMAVACVVSLAALAGQAKADGLDELSPDLVKQLYNKDMIDPAQPIGPSPYRTFKAKKGPWLIGYASSYAGNTWRANALDHLLKNIVPQWQKLGLVKDIIVTQSNLNDSTQIQQMRQLIDQGVDGLIICCSNPTALNQTIKYAYDKGVPVVTFTGYATSEYSINTSSNYQVTGFEIGKSMADALGGKGNVLVVEGIPGTSTSDSQDRGVKAGLASAPGIKVVGSIAGMWTDQVAQGEVQKWLATHPGKLDGIVVQSAAEMGVLRALAQSGRKGIKVAIGGELGALCTWRKNPELIDVAIQGWPPKDEMEMAWGLMMRTLEGQGPKVQSVLMAPVKLTHDDIMKLVPENCDENSQEWLAVGSDKWGGPVLDQFFVHPADPAAYKP
ncbi:ABC transporter substrate-binding protein [Aestuariivirga sp.]|uniref:ABC transporter substrate-binding protein n=1 Tax=Aestuariivirga sp. TaxID=2650926 RepID=UPI0039E3F4F5